MSTSHHVPVPTPLCAIYKPQLALLVFDLLEPDEAAHLRSHLAGCEYCQLHLRQYEIVHGALDRHIDAESSPLSTSGNAAPNAPARATHQAAMEASPRFTLEDIIGAAHEPPISAPAMHGPSRSEQLSPTQRRFSALSAIAAVLVLTVLAASLFSYFGSRGVAPAAKPTPTRGLDAQSQAYLNVLETYYQPVSEAFLQMFDCRGVSNPKTDSQWMQNCQSFAPPVVASAQALKDHLTVTPPARWQMADAQIKQATDDTITSFSASATATTGSEWSTAETHAELTACEYVAPITQINRELVPAGVPLSGQLGNPLGVC